VSGEWAKEKLYYLSKYMFIFNQGMRNRWQQRAFVDLMAGPGRCILEDRDDEFDGSPILAANCDPPFTSIIAVESSPRLLPALRTRTASYGPRLVVLEGDCNNIDTIAEIRSAIPANGLTLAFADMLGLEVTYETLRRLTLSRRVDLAITFQVNDLVRNVPNVMRGDADGSRLDRFFGTPTWRQRVADAEAGKLRSSEIGDALTDFYIERLATLGYGNVQPLHVLMKNRSKAPLYRLILAGKHPRAADFFRKISTYEFSGQRGLGFTD
jgi:three-Cys-motif partner protein